MKTSILKNVTAIGFVSIIWIIMVSIIGVIISRPVFAQTLSDYTAYPPFITTAAPPLTMFVMSKDHKLFYKAYNDIVDLDEDGTIDPTYKDTINYYGYFDPNKCYSYSSNRFIPQSLAAGANSHYCSSSSGRWSGNFLNWVSMARIDILRKVLYGGYRESDTSSLTVLGRTTLPQDAHSWAKVYTGTDISSLTPYSWGAITLCNLNTTKTETYSLLYAINGNFPYAASTEEKQCVKEKPGGSNLTVFATFRVNVQVCVTGLLETNCLEYKSGASLSKYKPSGLMQTFGVDRKGTVDSSDDTIAMKFGLMTGSYGANVSGGVIRSNISDVNNEIDNTNGQIKGSSRIVKTLNNLKVTQYNYSTGWYDYGGSEGTCVPSEPAILSNGVCTSWGNPIGEMLYETIRYFKGLGSHTTQFQASPTVDPGFSSLDVESSWSDPYASCPACSKPFALILSDEFPSYDSDHLPGSNWPATISTSDTPSVQSLNTTADINAIEGIGSVFIGQSGATFDRACTSKAGNFNTIRGLCPEEPTKEGSFYVAGLANYAKTNDLRPLIDGNQNMTTFVVSTGSAVPKMEFNVDGKKVQIVPIFHDGCPSTSYTGCASQGAGGDNSKGALVDFKLCPDDADWLAEKASPNNYTSCYDGEWDDAEYGWDYELDIQYRIYVKTGAATITLKTKGLAAAAGHLDFAGYNISGVTGAGEYYEIRCGGSAGFSDCDRYDNNESPINERTFSVTGSTTGFLKSPLWYAAKYGGFKDSDGSKTPNLVAEWDEDSDGAPDTFFDASNPLNLESALRRALTDILNRSSSGTSVSVLATAGEGEGALYQAYFFPSKFEGGDEKKWIGYLHGLFLDSFGNLREDTNQDGRLVLSDDKIVQSFYDTGTAESKVNKYLDADGDGLIDSTTVPPTPDETVLIGEMKPIWEAGERLALTNPIDRKIYTWVNANHNGVVDAGEFIEFKDSEKATLRPYLRAADNNESADIINFVRGDQVPGMRDRLLTIPSLGTQKVWKLGDIVYSTPTVVAAPRERYDLLYGDASYLAYFKQYKNRRQVVYVGGNDGMLHAFNAGFYNPGDDSSTPAAVEHGYFNAGVGKALGQELWSYVPYELLAHLKWLTMPDYTHVYYVDLKPKITDAQIFTPDATHPNGWGTVLIGGMRMGGGPITVTDAGFPSPTTRTFRSAYFVLDITDPEAPPTLLASFTSDDLNFTTSFPAVIRVKDNLGTAKWLFMAGSGPTTYSGTSVATSLFTSPEGHVKVVNLATGALEATFHTNLPNSFMGDPINVDGNLDFTSDVAYIGSSYQSGGVWQGKMHRLSIQNRFDPTTWVLSTLYDANPGPITAAGTASFGTDNKLWIYFGTGRYFTPSDAADTSQQRFYGIKDPCWNDTTLACVTTITSATLRDTTTIKIFTDASVTNAGADNTFSKLYASASSYDGWYFNLESKERVLAKSSVLGGSVFFTTFIPNGDECSAGGDSRLYKLFFETGTSYPEKLDPNNPICSSPPCEVPTHGDEVAGLPSAVGIHVGAKGGSCKGGVTGFVQQSTGAISGSCQKPPNPIRSGVKGWRDF